MLRHKILGFFLFLFLTVHLHKLRCLQSVNLAHNKYLILNNMRVSAALCWFGETGRSACTVNVQQGAQDDWIYSDPANKSGESNADCCCPLVANQWNDSSYLWHFYLPLTNRAGFQPMSSLTSQKLLIWWHNLCYSHTFLSISDKNGRFSFFRCQNGWFEMKLTDKMMTWRH